MQDLRTKALDIWAQLAPWQRFAGIAILLSTIGMFVVMGLWMNEPKYAVLYRDLNERDAAAIVNELDSQGVPYQLAEGGTAIEVDQDQVAAIRLRLAAQNLPQGGTIGYEMFDTGSLGNLGMTEFMQRVNYQRALEGELSRTIAAVEGVDLARVHLALPEESLFAQDQQQPKASVILKVKPGVKLNMTQVQSIRFLVANSVEGLTADNITVVDVDGNLYELPEGDGTPTLASVSGGILEMQRAAELERQNNVQAMLDQTFGPNKTVVRVNIEMNWDQEESQTESYAPAGEVGSVIRSSSREEENWEGAGANAGGIPGVEANAPLDDVTYQAGEGDTGTYNRRTDTVNYEVSKEIRSKTVQPGAVERITVAVLMDESLPEEQAEAVKSSVAAALGLNTERGDIIEVQRIPFDVSFYEQELAQFQAQQQQDFYIRIGIIVGVLIGLGLILFFTRKILGDMQKRMMPFVVEEDTLALPKDATGQQGAASLQQQANNAYARALAGSKGQGEMDDFEHIFQLPPPDEAELRLRAIARHSPDVVASIIEEWAVPDGARSSRNEAAQTA